MPARLPLSVLVAAALAVSAPATVIIAAAGPALAQTQRDAEAESFINQEANHALGILNNRNLSSAARKQAFHAFVDQAADVPRISKFVLGKYGRSISPAQFNEFSEAFRLYANSVYENRLGQYHGERLEVVNSIVRQPGDVVVTTRVVGGEVKQPAQVLWRVIRGGDGHYRAVDVSIDGVWLAITEQQDFVSTLDNNHGDINVLIAQLRSQTAQEDARRG